VYLNPFTALPFGSTAASSMSVDKGTSLLDLVHAASALRDPQTGTVPVASSNYHTNAGDSVLWNKTQATELFKALKKRLGHPEGLAGRHYHRLNARRTAPGDPAAPGRRSRVSGYR